MTDKQREVLNALRRFIAKNGYSPSIAELMEEVGTKSRNRVQSSLSVLRDEGEVIWTKGTNRTLRLVRDGEKAFTRAD